MLPHWRIKLRCGMHPSDLANTEFCSLYKQEHPRSFELYAGMKDEVVVMVKPSLLTLWKYIDGKPCRDYLYLIKNIAYREYYDLES